MINKIGELRQWVAIVSFVSWIVLTLAGIQSMPTFFDQLNCYFIGPIIGGIGIFSIKIYQYKTSLLKLEKDEKITWAPMTYAVLLLPIFVTLIGVALISLHMIHAIVWIPSFLFINISVQYAFFFVANKK